MSRARRIAVASCLVCGLLVAVSLAAHYIYPSVRISAFIMNETTETVSVRFHGSFFERGRVELAPGQSKWVVVYRGDDRPRDDFAVSLQVERAGHTEEVSIGLGEIVAVRAEREQGRPTIAITADRTYVRHEVGGVDLRERK